MYILRTEDRVYEVYEDFKATQTFHGKIPEEAWTYVRRFSILMHHGIRGGSEAEKVELDPKGMKRVFVGYVNNLKGYRIYNQKNREINISRDVKILNEGQCNGEMASRNDKVDFLKIEPQIC